MNEVAAMLASELKRHGIVIQIDHGLPRLGDVRRNFSDTGKAKKLLDWSSETSLEKGLTKTIEWFLNF